MGKCSSGLSSVDTIPIQFWDYPLPLQFSPLPHTFTHTHTHVYTHMHTHAHTCTHMYTHLYTCICTHREYLAKKEEIDRMRAEQDQLRKRRDVSTQLLEHHITCVDCVGVLVGLYLSHMSVWIVSMCWWGCICPICLCGLEALIG